MQKCHSSRGHALKGVEQEVKPVNQKEFFDVLHAPYVKGFSEGLQRKLRKFNIGFVPKKRGDFILEALQAQTQK